MTNKDIYSTLASEMETTLQRDVLGVWFPRSVDKESGGFYSNFTRDWKPCEQRRKILGLSGPNALGSSAGHDAPI
jgi:mannose/cellobiose epimerase-like protein (N-acyl-D-glucosamine 2-epimerase family)